MYIVDRRLNPSGKNLANRQRFMRRAKSLIRTAVHETSASRGIKDADTGQLLNRELLNQELTKIEKPAGIANPKDFRNEVVKFALRARATHGGKNPS